METTKNFTHAKSGTLTLCFTAPPKTPAQLVTVGEPVPANLQPAGEQETVTAAARTAAALGDHADNPAMLAILTAVAKSNGDPATFLKNIAVADEQLQTQVKAIADDEDAIEIDPATAAEFDAARLKQRAELQADADALAQQNDDDAQTDAIADAVKAMAQNGVAPELGKGVKADDDPNDNDPIKTPDEMFGELAGVVGPAVAKILKAAGIASLEAAQSAPAAQLDAIRGVGPETIKALKAAE